MPFVADHNGRASGRHEPVEQAGSGPLVTVILPTFNRPKYIPIALAGVLHQSYRNLQVIVVNDGGADVGDIVTSFNDPRIVFINRRQNRGKAFSLNEALSRAAGKYVAYLDDDDLFYPDHVAVLLDTLEGNTDCQVAYSDLYETYCDIMPDGRRIALSKMVNISRDFDRYLMLYYNHVLHVSMMHRLDLVEKTGPYNESLNVLIDWDITRRLVFFTDFRHVPVITGEYYNPAGRNDRISVQRRKDQTEYLRNVLAIRSARPKKPWPKLADLSVILLPNRLDKQVGETIGRMWRYTFYPYKLHLPLAGGDRHRFSTDMPHLVTVPVQAGTSFTDCLDAALHGAEGDYIAVVPDGLPINDMWVEKPLYALIGSTVQRQAFELGGSDERVRGVVLRRRDLQYARKRYPQQPFWRCLDAAGITIRKPCAEDLPFQFDRCLQDARLAQADGDFARAAYLFQYAGEQFNNRLWMDEMAARAYFDAGDCANAARLSHRLNQQRATVDTLLLEAKIERERGRAEAAIGLLTRAEHILAGEVNTCHAAEPTPCSH